MDLINVITPSGIPFFMDASVKTTWEFSRYYFPFTRYTTEELDQIQNEVLYFKRFWRIMVANNDMRFRCVKHMVHNRRLSVDFLFCSVADALNYVWLSDKTFYWMDHRERVGQFLNLHGESIEDTDFSSPLSPSSPMVDEEENLNENYDTNFDAVSVEGNTSLDGGELLNGMSLPCAPIGIYADSAANALNNIMEEIQEIEQLSVEESNDYILIDN